MREFNPASGAVVLRLARARRETSSILIVMATCAAGASLVCVLTVKALVESSPRAEWAVYLAGLAVAGLIAFATLSLVFSIFRRDANRIELGDRGVIVPRFGSWDIADPAKRLLPWPWISKILLIETREELDGLPEVKAQDWMPSPDGVQTQVFDRRGSVRPKDIPLLAIWTHEKGLFVFAKIVEVRGE